MDTGKIVARIKGILTEPQTEWPVIAAEPETMKGLFTSYIMIVAALPAVAGFIKHSLIGVSALGIHARAPFVAGLLHMVLSYVLSLAVIYLMSLIINALAPTFGGSKDPVQALKAAAYAWTAAWVAGIAIIVPWLGALIALAGAIYGIYLLYLGLPATMKCPRDMAAGYTAVSFIIALVLSWIVGIVLALALGAGFGGAVVLDHARTQVDRDNDNISVDAPVIDRIAAAGAQAGRMGKEKVEAIEPDTLKAFLPEGVDGRKRQGSEASREGGAGMQVSTANATYGDDPAHAIRLEIVDMGGARAMMAVAMALAPESEQDTGHGYEKSHTEGGRVIHEKWDTQAKDGEYGVMVGKRFNVQASGNVDSIDQLKAAVDAVDMDKLEALRDEGVSAK
ncbi:MAG TPA: Yip1 family protein [Luteibacter sp.]|nr:Yip1 family protein [Luteibacter sp.]